MKMSKALPEVVLEVLGNEMLFVLQRNYQKLKADYRRDKQYVKMTSEWTERVRKKNRLLAQEKLEQAEVIAELVGENAMLRERTGSVLDPPLTRPRLGLCEFCKYLIEDGEGGVCICGEYSYCSEYCQMGHWTKRHRGECPCFDQGPGDKGIHRLVQHEDHVVREMDQID